MSCFMQLMLLTLLDGTLVYVRPIAPEDKPLLVAGLRALSPETAMKRFLSPEGLASARRAALPDRGRPARPHRLRGARRRPRSSRSAALRARPAPDVADLAVVVGDPWQGQGLGRRLMELLAERAAEEGIDPLRGHDAGRQPRRAAADARVRPARARRHLVRRARGRHTSGRLSAVALKRPPRGRRCTSR